MEFNLYRDKTVVVYLCIVFVLCLSSFYQKNYVVGSLFILSVVAGICMPLVLFGNKVHFPNLLSILIASENCSKRSGIPRSCSICGGEQCSRHHTTGLINFYALSHTNFTVPHAVDEALEGLLNDIFNWHIYPWYKEFSIHDQLGDDVRYMIRYASASLCVRLSKVDLSKLILDSVLPSALSHFDSYVEGTRRLGGNRGHIEACVLDYLRSNGSMHVAVASREAEGDYLRGVVATLFPYVVPLKYQESRLGRTFLRELLGNFLIRLGLDLLADPDNLNLIFLFLLRLRHPDIEEDMLKREDCQNVESHVLLLKNFTVQNAQPRNSAIRCDLSIVLKDQGLLYLFHAFLKDEGAINVLQFCLAVEDFNHHILDPELSQEQLEVLHREAQHLYHTYVATTAYDRLDFDTDIVQQIKNIVHSEASDIVKLRTTRPLFQAYEYAYNLLEKEYLPLFVDSGAYFGHICVSKSAQAQQRNSTREPSSLPLSLSQKVGLSLRSISKQISLRTDVIVGEMAENIFIGHMAVDEAHDMSAYLMDDGVMETRRSLSSLSEAFRDLSAWRVAIPRIEQKLDATGKMSFVFIVDVQRIDVSGDNPDELHWEVERRYHEFYILEAKLKEFHGEFSDNLLPPRRSLFSSKGIDFMYCRREIFEDYLQKLLQKPALRGSQLLFLFFKSRDEFTANYLPDVSLGRLLRDVPRKLIKERGQYLDSFIESFITSTGQFGKNGHLFEHQEDAVVDCPEMEHLMPTCSSVSLGGTGSIFGDNAHSAFERSAKECGRGTSLTTPPLQTIKVEGILDSLTYLGVHLFGMSLALLRWVMCLKVVFGNTIDAAAKWWLHRKLTQGITATRIVKLVTIIQDALFAQDATPLRSQKDKEERRLLLKQECLSLVPCMAQRLLFHEKDYKEGIERVVDLFQHPVLNKQLCYVLLDIALLELFPELRDHRGLKGFKSDPQEAVA